jgi:hypothetical protein
MFTNPYQEWRDFLLEDQTVGILQAIVSKAAYDLGIRRSEYLEGRWRLAQYPAAIVMQK